MMKRDAVLKSLAAGLCAALFLAAAVRLIQWEGERTRRALRETTADAVKEMAQQLADGAGPLADTPAERTDTVGRDDGKGVHEGVGETTEPASGLAGEPPARASADVEQTADGQGPEPPGPAIAAQNLPPPKPATTGEQTAPTGSEGAAADIGQLPPVAPMPPAAEEGPDAKVPPVAHVPALFPKPVLPGPDPPPRRPPPDRVPPAADGPMPAGQKDATPLRPVYPSGRDEPATIYHHASTLEEGSMRGMADLVRSQGQANLDHSAAAINYSLARQNEIQNRARWTRTYFEMRRMNRAYRAQERGPPPGMQDLVRYAQAGKPTRLGPDLLDCVSGRIQWPLLLQAEQFASGRAVLEGVFAQRAQQGGIGVEDYLEIRRTTGQMKAALKDQLRQVPPSQYVIAKRFLESLAYEADLPAS